MTQLALGLLCLLPLVLCVNNNDIQFLQVHNVPALPGYVLAEPSSFGPQVCPLPTSVFISQFCVDRCAR